MHSTPISFHLSRITYVFLGIVAGVFIGTTIKFALGWNAPLSTPPQQDEIFVPVNTGSASQVKSGGLSLGSLMVQGSADVKGRIKIGNITDDTCDATVEGTQRYNSTNKKMEFCNGTSWQTIAEGAVGPMKWFSGTGCAACPYGFTASGTRQACNVKNQNGTVVAAIHPLLGGITIGFHQNTCTHTGQGTTIAVQFGFWSY